MFKIFSMLLVNDTSKIILHYQEFIIENKKFDGIKTLKKQDISNILIILYLA